MMALLPVLGRKAGLAVAAHDASSPVDEPVLSGAAVTLTTRRWTGAAVGDAALGIRTGDDELAVPYGSAWLGGIGGSRATGTKRGIGAAPPATNGAKAPADIPAAKGAAATEVPETPAACKAAGAVSRLSRGAG